MKRLLLAATLVLAMASTAQAQNVASSQTYRVLNVTSTAVFTIVAAQWVGVMNASATAQTATLTCFDSPTPGSLSGLPLPTIAALGASQVITLLGPGRPVTNGNLVCQASAPPIGNGIEVYVR